MSFDPGNHSEIQPRGIPPAWLIHGLFSLLLLAIVANGLYFWLLKNQIADSSAYADYLSLLREKARGTLQNPDQFLLGGFYISPGKWIFTKILKDVFIFIFALTSILSLKHYLPLSFEYRDARALGLPVLFAISVAIAAGYSFLAYGPWVAVAGIRPIFYILAGAIAVWAAEKSQLELLSRYLVVILVIELLMSIYEAIYGLPLFTSSRAVNRAAGTFSFPTSLGIFAVFTFTFVSAYSSISKIALLFLVVPLVYLTGSATALILLLIAIAFWLWLEATPFIKRWTPVAFAGFLLATFLTLPYLVERDDIYESLWGRIEPFEDYLTHLPQDYELLFGKGIGIGSNVLSSIVNNPETTNKHRSVEPKNVDLEHARTDSTPLALLNQVGLMGTIFFYMTLLIAAKRDPRSAPAFLILLVAGMAINILELFPLNFLLGIMLCRSLKPNFQCRNLQEE